MIIKRSMKRKAILIFNDGGPGNYLPGVKIDKANYIDFLTSPEGGAWDISSEIRVYDNNCTKNLLLNYINTNRIAEHIGYWLIVFSGHGYTNSKHETILELSPGNDCSVQSIKDATEYSRRLLIADSCRKIYHNISESIKGKLKLFSAKSTDIDYIKRCRDLYMDRLEKVYDNTFNATYAAAYNQAANDDDTTGGFYSYELLKAAREVVSTYKDINCLSDRVFSIKSIHDMAANAVANRTNNAQTPVSEGFYLDEIPFVVVPK